MKFDPGCTTCGAVLTGRQRRFCSRRCKNSDTNHRNQGYAKQQARGLARKLQLLAESGSRCSMCGYDRNLAALTWHHLEPGQKAFSLDMRSMSNRSEVEVRNEAIKCVVLCANCHAETHFPKLASNIVSPARKNGRESGR